MLEEPKLCSYVRHDKTSCPHAALAESQYCFWHDPDVNKDQPDLRKRLEALGNSGESLEGFSLKRTNLEGLRFRVGHKKHRVNMSHCDLYRANVRNAHLYRINLQHSSLIKTDFYNTNLNSALLNKADMLGIQFTETKLEHVRWGNTLIQEDKAEERLREGDKQTAKELFIEAEEIYRYLYRECEQRKFLEQAGFFFHQEMRVRHKQLSFLSKDWWWSTLVELSCGYGEKPGRVIVFSLVLIFLFAILFFAAGLNGPNGLIAFRLHDSLLDNLRHFYDCLYFSVVTFTTLGYGDISPTLSARGLAAFEAFLGSFILALFVVVFVRKIMR